MFGEYPKLCDILKSRYPFIMIDEYQDTFTAVIEILLSHLKKSKKKVRYRILWRRHAVYL